MAARGAESKEKVMQNILKTFPGAFKYDKEIRIPMIENGEEVQIKVTLTAAKTNVASGRDTAMPGESVAFTASSAPAQLKHDVATMEPTAEEKENISNFLKMMGM